MSAKHTQGQWRLSADGDEVTVSPVGILEASKTICKISSAYRSDEERRANGLVIAAAPELLDAVRGQHNIIDILLATLILADPTFRPTQSDVWPLIAKVGAVQLIAKATGNV